MTDPSYEVKHATCTFCGCVCDNIDLTVENGRITKAKNACVLGKTWFLEHTVEDRPPALIGGQPAEADAAIEEAAQILARARFPVIYGLSDTTCEAQRQAAALADLLGANIDTTTSVCYGPSGMAFQGGGEVSATLGEVKNRADLVIYWGSNPVKSHPRHFTRYSVTPKGMFTPNGKEDRTVVLVDVRRTPSTHAADIFIQVRPGKDFEVLWALRALVKGVPLGPEIEGETGVPLETLEDLVRRMKACRFGVLFFGMGLSMTRGKHFNSGALLALTTDLNQYTRFVAKPVRSHGNVAGADNVLSWQTGFPFGVNLSRGFPRFNPGEFTTVDLLVREEADAVLIIASDPASYFPKRAMERLAAIPTIVLDPRESETVRVARVAITTATYGINVAGTVYRMDDVPIRMRKAFDAPYPSDEDVLRRMINRVREIKRLEIGD